MRSYYNGAYPDKAYCEYYQSWTRYYEESHSMTVIGADSLQQAG